MSYFLTPFLSAVLAILTPFWLSFYTDQMKDYLSTCTFSNTNKTSLSSSFFLYLLPPLLVNNSLTEFLILHSPLPILGHAWSMNISEWIPLIENGAQSLLGIESRSWLKYRFLDHTQRAYDSVNFWQVLDLENLIRPSGGSLMQVAFILQDITFWG